MKKIFTLIIGIGFSLTILNAQDAPPQAFSFKAMIKDNKSSPVVLKTISLRISILQGSVNGTEVYVETFRPTTNVYAQVDVEIGRGTNVNGSFSGINWALDEYFIKVEVDVKGGTNYTVMSVSQLLSVPYALYSGSAANSFSGRWDDLIGTPFTLAGYGITDAMSKSDPAYQISNTNINNWNIASGWGKHDGLYMPITYKPAWENITSIPTGFADGIDNVDDADNSLTNEIQTLTIEGNVLVLSEGGRVTLPTITGQYYFLDRDNDNFGDQYSPVWAPSGVEPPAHFVVDNTDCNDNSAVVHPDLAEIDDDIDNDCDGLIDENIPVCTPGSNEYRPCGGGVGDCSGGSQTRICGPDGFWSDWSICEGETLPSLEICDGLDNDCDGEVDENVVCPSGQCIAGRCVELDIDEDGYQSNEGDCDDNDPTIHPGAREIIGDGIDQDCDGLDETSLPSSFDWRSYNGSNWMTPVKNQGSCGSCFAVAAVAAFEAKIKIQSNRPDLAIDLSEQEYLSCGLTDFNCNGGSTPPVLNYIRDHGIVEESVFPYTSAYNSVPQCISLEGQKKYKIAEWETLPYNMAPNDIKQALINKGPIIFYTYVDMNLFSNYTGGILLPPNDGGGINKTMLLIGYNDAERYWVVENTWASWWGENGCYRLSYDATSYSMPYKFVINSVVLN